MSKNKAKSNALTPKTGEQRQSWLSLAFVQAGICVCIPSFLEGALLAGKMPFWEAIASGTVGYVIVVVIMSILGFMGSDLGLASCSLAESTFGRKGARYIISVVYAINLVGWFGINNQECAQSFSNFMMSSFNIHIPVAASGIGWGAHHASYRSLRYECHRKTQCRLHSSASCGHVCGYCHCSPTVRTFGT